MEGGSSAHILIKHLQVAEKWWFSSLGNGMTGKLLSTIQKLMC